MSRSRVLVCGAGGFIGQHLVKKLKRKGVWVRAVDLKRPAFSESPADEFVIGDLRDSYLCRYVLDQPFDEVYQLAADMGGAGYIFTGEHDADLMHNSATINLNVLRWGASAKIRKIFFSSSACIYPERNQMDPDNPLCSEASAYPAAPDSEYGWEKLFSERLYLTFRRNHSLNVRVARFHNIFGEEACWNNGKEKAPSALCRKVAEAAPGGAIEIWGDGAQTRSFLHIDECLKGVELLMASDFAGPVNIGSEEMISINDLARLVMDIAAKPLSIRNIPGPTGVRGRRSDNTLLQAELGWAPDQPLRAGLERTYWWIHAQVVEHAQRHRHHAADAAPQPPASLPV
jgi:nucleoside-diphosphate-sugar epimerase